jgi:hypothetical protein
VARQKYKELKKAEHHIVSVEKCGLIVHPQEPWLGASPDGVVTDHCCTPSKGLQEIKCPYSMREITPTQACCDPSFYCTLESGSIKLKRNHQYYHQVQLQLFVCSNEYHFCDFCIYTPMGVAVERIILDINWIENSIPKLEDYYDNCILPELVYPMDKPAYVL